MAATASPAPPAGATTMAPADPRAGLFDIVLDFAGAQDETLQSAFVAAAERLETVVLGDLPDVAVPSINGAPPAVVDDLVIRVELPAIDGPGGVLGIAGPTLLRADSLLPAAAQMRFDAADAASLQAEGAWDEAVLHEMLHCLGFGVLWQPKGLLAAGGAGYVGPAGMAAYAALGNAGPVPVEVTGGPGTAGLHWSEAVFGAELMTGWIDDTGPLSPLTVASLADLGYGLAPRQAWPLDSPYV